MFIACLACLAGPRTPAEAQAPVVLERPWASGSHAVDAHDDDFDSLLRRLEANERRTRQLEAALGIPADGGALRHHGGAGWGHSGIAPAGSNCQDCDKEASAACSSETAEKDDEDGESELSNFYVDYDGGFVIRPRNEKETPFELQVNGRMQFRHVGFKRDRKTFANRGGVVDVESRNDFEIERGRLEFRGFFYDPRLEYFINIDADTDDNHRAIFHDFWVNYEIHEALDVHVGKAKVPGSRDWLNSSTRLRFNDRSMGTTFFRPDRSVGVWAVGELAEGLHYHAMVSNGFDTTNLEPDDVDDLFVYSGMMWWEPLGELGRGYTDLDGYHDVVLRIGHAFTYGNQNEDFDGSPTPEESRVARLSDGTPLVAPGALAPGVSVNDFDVQLYTIFLLAKYRGLSVNAEYYFRWLNNFGTTGGPIPHSVLYDDGFYADVGCMVIPERLEIMGRISQVDGLFGDAWEYAAGFNWFIDGTHKNKVTFDISVLDGSPASSSSPNYAVGQDGVLVRTQWQAAF